ncbi:MAG TPA: UPF0147 family protein [Candidatus Nanoarchaeia archaeon]|nr:UPF0147 family protein [Candidatus Nanoarchaeia archaeon]
MKDVEKVQVVVENLCSIESDATIPKNVRQRIKVAIDILNAEDRSLSLRIDKSIQELGDVAEDPNVPQYMKMMIWSAVSQLESK